MKTTNHYLVTYNDVTYPTLTLAARMAGVKRTTFTKAVNVKFRKPEVTTNKINITVQNQNFTVVKYSVN